MNIGVTGHRYLDDPSAWVWVEAEMGRALVALSPPLVAVSCLAIGADQLLAKMVLRRGGRLRAIIPFADYERMFPGQDAVLYRALLTKAEPEILRTQRTDEDAFLVAGQRVALLSDVLFAVWDGESAHGIGGTADVVAYARQKRIPYVHFNPRTRKVSREPRYS